MRKKVLVTGSTGATGSKTVKFLIDAGAGVRAFVHREDERSAALAAQGAEIVRGDLLDFEAVRAALEGTQGAYFVYPIMPGILQATAYFAQAFEKRKVTPPRITGFWSRSSTGVPVTHLRPTLFAEWALYWTDLIKTGTLRLPFGTGKHAPIAAEDQARVITKILLAPDEHKGKVYPLYGEKEYTFPEIAAAIGKVIGKPVGYEQVDAWTLKRLAANSPRPTLQTDTIWQHFAEIAKDHQNGVFARTNDVVEKIGGKRPIGLPEFLEAHRSAFLS